ncbi:hypothetical protein F52700_6210 [Fusarium sp. NRRL 52700]|nr:hypothetical protein F52700_6210 [Fusarium sp. NRRL 52700]
MSAASLLGAVFPMVDGKLQKAEDLVKGFDFSKMSTKDSTRDDFLHCSLAPSFGTLNGDTIKKLDDEMKIMIVGLTKALAKLPANQRSWDTIVSLCAQNPLLAPLDEGVSRSDSLIKNSSGDFKTDGSPDSGIVKEVNAWFKKLISDEDVINSTKIDIDVLGRIVAQSGATIDSFEAFFAKTEEHEKTLVNIGVLRYPDMDNPFFKIYRIQLTAWSKSERVLFHQEDQNGIQGLFNMRRYKPRGSVIDNLRQEVKQKACQDAEDLLSF